jgi:hypothetical protein
MIELIHAVGLNISMEKNPDLYQALMKLLEEGALYG